MLKLHDFCNRALDAERTLAATRAAAIDALLSYHIAQAQLERLTARAPVTQGE